MGRNIKHGLSYFPLDADFFEDEKVQFVSARFGVKGDGILVRLMCKIYRNGYYMNFNEDVSLLFARSVGDVNIHGLVKDVVCELLKRDFFNEDIFKSFGILTSRGIQKRYEKICVDSKRKDWEIEKRFDLIRSKCAFTPEEIDKTPEESTQRKEKESKEKNLVLVDDGKPSPPPKETHLEKQKKLIERSKDFGLSLQEFEKTYSREMLKAFYNYWKEPNKSKTKMKFEMEATWDLKLRLIRWEENNYKFKKGNNQQPDELNQKHKSEFERAAQKQREILASND